MIIKVIDKIFCIITPQKSGISSVTSILSYPITKKTIHSKNINRQILSKYNSFFHVGGTLKEELEFVKKNNIKIDYLYGVIRDPLDRFESAYKDRVLKKNTDQFQDNSLEFIIENLQNFINLKKDFGLHARPQTRWLGDNPKIYDKIFNTLELNLKFKPFVEEVAGISIPETRLNVSNDNIKISFTQEQSDFLRQFYKKDFLFLDKLNKL